MLEISQDGSVSFDPSGGFEDLNTGDTDLVVFGYAAADTNGNVDGADVVITVDGVDDPEVGASVAAAPLQLRSAQPEVLSTIDTGEECVVQFTDPSGFLMTLLVTENADGTLTFDLEVDESTGQTGDVRAIFLNNTDDVEYTNLEVASVDPASDVGLDDVDLVQDINDVRKVVENDTNINGQVLKGNGGRFDTGIEFGKSGIGRNRDDVQSVSFVVSADEPLTLESFDFDSLGLRVTSTGDVGGDRTDHLN